MILSMTGFGEASAQVNQVHYALELRSLNNRYFKLTARLPEQLAVLEAELESRVRKKVHRGSFTLTVKMYMDDDKAASQINEAALMSYLNHLKSISEKTGNANIDIDLANLLNLPGVLVLNQDDEKIVSAARPILFDLLDKATANLKQMRLQEGKTAADDLLKQRNNLLNSIETIQDRAPKVIDEYHDKLRARIDELMAKASLETDKKDLLREVALFADRADISEELSRLGGHLEQFEKIINISNEPAGRTLDFLCQELLREANTIASKSSDTQIARATVNMKSSIDRIKEQVQNIE